MALEGIVFGEISQTEKDNYHVVSLTWGIPRLEKGSQLAVIRRARSEDLMYPAGTAVLVRSYCVIEICRE